MCIRDRDIKLNVQVIDTEEGNYKVKDNLKDLLTENTDPVSYTHLDVYKRQIRRHKIRSIKI